MTQFADWDEPIQFDHSPSTRGPPEVMIRLYEPNGHLPAAAFGPGGTSALAHSLTVRLARRRQASHADLRRKPNSARPNG
jgi:hypothetical protein